MRASCSSTHHQIGNILIEFAGSYAKVESYVPIDDPADSPYPPSAPYPHDKVYATVDELLRVAS